MILSLTHLTEILMFRLREAASAIFRIPVVILNKLPDKTDSAFQNIHDTLICQNSLGGLDDN